MFKNSTIEIKMKNQLLNKDENDWTETKNWVEGVNDFF